MIKRLLIPMLAMLLAVLACNPLAGDEADGDEPAPAEDASAENAGDEGEEAAAEESGDAGDSQSPGSFVFSGLGLDDHNSFSFVFEGQVTPVDSTAPEDEANFSGSMTVQRDPELATWEFFASLPEGAGGDEAVQTGAGTITGYLVDGVVYSVIGAGGAETCVGVPETGDTIDDTLGIFMGPGSFNDPRYQTEELTLVESGVEVNGYTTDHYRGENISNEEFQNGTVDLWVIQGDEVPARLMLLGQSEDDEAGTVTVEWQYDLVGLDLPVEVTVPENCTVLGGDS